MFRGFLYLQSVELCFVEVAIVSTDVYCVRFYDRACEALAFAFALRGGCIRRFCTSTATAWQAVSALCVASYGDPCYYVYFVESITGSHPVNFVAARLEWAYHRGDRKGIILWSQSVRGTRMSEVHQCTAGFSSTTCVIPAQFKHMYGEKDAELSSQSVATFSA